MNTIPASPIPSHTSIEHVFVCACVKTVHPPPPPSTPLSQCLTHRRHSRCRRRRSRCRRIPPDANTRQMVARSICTAPAANQCLHSLTHSVLWHRCCCSCLLTIYCRCSSVFFCFAQAKMASRSATSFLSFLLLC